MAKKKVKVSITVIEGQDKGNTFQITKSSTVIGRTAGDVIINDPKISRKHAKIIIKDGSVSIKDMGSTNGIMLNDVKVEEAELTNLDELTLGFTKVSVAIVEDLKSFKEKNVSAGKKSGKSFAGADTGDIGKMIEEELSRFSRWDVSAEGSDKLSSDQSVKALAYMEVIEGPDKGKRMKLKKGTTVLGRGKADVAFRDTDISRAHCEVEVYSKDQIFIRDLASTNGTYVNDKKVTYTRLSHEDEVLIGGTRIKLSILE